MKTLEDKFVCDCKGHRIVVCYEPDKDSFCTTMSLIIERHVSNNTGKAIKKPKLEADVMLDQREITRFLNFIKKVDKVRNG